MFARNGAMPAEITELWCGAPCRIADGLRQSSSSAASVSHVMNRTECVSPPISWVLASIVKEREFFQIPTSAGHTMFVTIPMVGWTRFSLVVPRESIIRFWRTHVVLRSTSSSLPALDNLLVTIPVKSVSGPETVISTTFVHWILIRGIHSFSRKCSGARKIWCSTALSAWNDRKKVVLWIRDWM